MHVQPTTADTVILGMAVQVAPLFITPMLIKFSSGILGRVAGMINDRSKGPVDRLRNWATGAAQERRNNAVLLPLAHSAQRQVHTSVLFGLDVCFDQTLNRLRVSASASQKPNTAYTVSTPTCSHGLFGHWSMNKGRTSSTALVKGSQSDIDLTNAGS